MGQRSVPAPFLTKTYQLVDDPATDEVVSWGQNGNSFVVWKTADFARDLLPTYFKHSNFSSFIRQLNTYGFRKVVANKWEFANDNFRKGEADLLSKIRRRKAIPLSKKQMQKPVPININPYCHESMTGGGGGGEGDDDMGSTSTSSSSPVTRKDNYSIKVMEEEEAAAAATPSAGGGDESNSKKKHQQQEEVDNNILSYENEKLRRDNEILSSELDQTKKQCDGLIAFLTKHLKVGSDQINSILTLDGTGTGAQNYTANNQAAGGDHEDKSCLENEHDDDCDEKDRESIHRKKKKKKMMIIGRAEQPQQLLLLPKEKEKEKEEEKGNVEGLRLFGFLLKKGAGAGAGGGGPCCMEIANQQEERNRHNKGYSWLSEESLQLKINK